MRNAFEVTIVKDGHYVGRCAELCGTYHSMMNFELRVVSGTTISSILAAKISGKSTPEALAAIGQAPLATTTCPFNTDRENRRRDQLRQLRRGPMKSEWRIFGGMALFLFLVAALYSWWTGHDSTTPTTPTGSAPPL